MAEGHASRKTRPLGMETSMCCSSPAPGAQREPAASFLCCSLPSPTPNPSLSEVTEFEILPFQIRLLLRL